MTTRKEYDKLIFEIPSFIKALCVKQCAKEIADILLKYESIDNGSYFKNWIVQPDEDIFNEHFNIKKSHNNDSIIVEVPIIEALR